MKKHFKNPWQLLKLIANHSRRDEWIIDVTPAEIKFSIKNHNKLHWVLFDFDQAIIQIPNQDFEIELVHLANPRGQPYHLHHDKFGAGEEFEPDELHLLRALYEICKSE